MLATTAGMNEGCELICNLGLDIDFYEVILITIEGFSFHLYMCWNVIFMWNTNESYRM